MTVPSPTIRICSIDDHEVVHTGLEHMASIEPDFEFAGALGDPATAIEFVAERSPDIVLLDLYMHDEQGWSTCRDIVATVPTVKVLMYSGYGNSQLVDRALRLGASGYLLKSTSIRELPGLLRSVLRTGECIDPALERDWHRYRRQEQATVTDRELEIVRLIAAGNDNYAIAERLAVSFHTVKFDIGKLLKRTGEPNRAGLVRWAKERFLIE